MQPKVWWKSKTVWLNVFAVLSMMVPALDPFFKEYFGGNEAIGFSIANILLRFISKDPVTIK